MSVDRKTKLLLQNPQKRWAWIIYQLKIRDTSIAEVARCHHLSRQTLGQVKYTPYPKGERHIADALGMVPHELFPERYNDNGLPNRANTRPSIAYFKDSQNDSTGSTSRNLNTVTGD